MLAWPPAWSGPRFAAYAPTIARVAAWSRWPTVAELDRALADGLGAAPVRLVEQVADTAPYELAIADQGCVPTRADNAHDLWNAIVWATFPAAKRALTARLADYQRVRHAGGAKLPGGRAPAHDRLALLDEGGLVAVGGRAVVLGHAILEHAARGEVAVRAAVLRLSADVPWRAAAVDAALAAALADGAAVAPGPGVAIDDAALAPWDP